MEFDIIKVTAQFVARNGRQFMELVSGRELRNPQFEFLRPHSPHYETFQKLVQLSSMYDLCASHACFQVDAYSNLMIFPTEVLQDLKLAAFGTPGEVL